MKNTGWLIAIIVIIIAAVAGGKYLGMRNSATSESDRQDQEGSEISNTPEPQTSIVKAEYFHTDENMIVVTSPLPSAQVPGTFVVTGKARGIWYFEASFPLEVQDESGKTLKQMPVQATGDWMTQDFVPFVATVTVPTYHGAAKLILKNDNPSGMPENEKSVTVPIIIQ